MVFSRNKLHYKEDLVSMGKSTSPIEQYSFSSRDMRENDIFVRSIFRKKKKQKFENHHSILTCLLFGTSITAQESFWDNFFKK